MNPKHRHRARIIVLQSLFSSVFRHQAPNQIFEYLMKDQNTDKIDVEFAHKLIEGVNSQLSLLDEQITDHAPEWPIDKIAPIDRHVLEIGLFELLYMQEETPELVSINEAVELAKQFGNDNSSKFVNAVLSAVYEKSGAREKIKK